MAFTQEASVSADHSAAGGHTDLSVLRALTIVATVLIVAAVTRTILADYSLWFDELASVFFARQPLHHLWSGWMVRETNPPLYYTVLKGWIALVGVSPLKLRLLSIAFSLGAIFIAYAGTAKSYGQRAGTVAALMLLVSAQQLHFAHQVRTYMFLYLAISIAFYALLHITNSEKADRQLLLPWFYYLGGSAMAVYLHTTACVWPLAATASLMLVDHRFRPFAGRRWLTLIAVNLVLLLLRFWWLRITYLQLGLPNGNIGWISPPTLRDTALTFFSTIFLARDAYGVEKIVPFAIAALAAFGVYRTWGRTTTRLTASCLVLSVLIFTLVSFRQPIIIDRTIFWVSIFPVTLAAVGLGTIRNRTIFLSTLLAAIALLGFNWFRVSRTLEKEDWASAVSVISRDHDAVVITNSEGMNIATNMACFVELSLPRCPFVVMTFAKLTDRHDAWATGLTDRVDFLKGGHLALPDTTRAYLVRRGKDDLFLDKRSDAALLKADTRQMANFVGPYSARAIRALTAHAHVKDGRLLAAD